MAVDVRQSTSVSMTLVTDEVWSSPSGEILDTDGSVLVASATVTQDSTSTTIASSPTSADTFAFDDGGGTVGKRYLITHDGQGYVVMVVKKTSANVLTVVPPLPETPDAGDAVQGLDLSVTIPTAATGTLGHNYQFVVTDADDASREARLVFHVVHRLFLTVLSAFDVQRLIDERWPSAVITWQELEGLVADVKDEIRAKLLRFGDYAHQYIDPAPFRDLGEAVALKRLALKYSLVEAGVDDLDDYIGRLNREVRTRLADIVASFQPVDEDDDGEPDARRVARAVVVTR